MVNSWHISHNRAHGVFGKEILAIGQVQIETETKAKGLNCSIEILLNPWCSS